MPELVISLRSKLQLAGRGHGSVAKIVLFSATAGSVGTATYERVMGLVCAVWNDATLIFDVISNRG